MYELFLLFGALGFLVMVFMGMGHSGGHVGHAGHALGHGGHALGGHAGHHALGSHAGHAAHGAHAHAGNGDAGHGQAQQSDLLATTRTGHLPETRESPVLRFIPSPMDVFCLALGAGATGMLVGTALGPALTAWVALAGALVLDIVVMRPLLNLFMNFASKESEGLEGQVAHPAEALCRFDAQGKGLVRVTLDGQISQLLAELDPDEHSAGVEVHKGDEVLVIEVDSKAGKCRVSREMTADDSTQ